MAASVAALALRIWWPVIAVLTAIGAVGGVVAARDAPFAAVTTIRVDTAGFGEVAQEAIVETARLLVDSNRTYAKVVGDTSGAIEEIRQRTAVDPVATSSVLEIVVTAQTAAQAEREVDALADAAISVVRELAEEQFTETIEAGERGLANGGVRDPVAEQARRDALGTAIAAQQDVALRLSASLSRIGEVLPATREGVGPRLAALIGMFTGAVVGVAIALFLGIGRRRIRSLGDVRVISEGMVDCEPLGRAEGVARVAAETSRLTYPLVVVLGLRGAATDVGVVTAELREELYRDGSRPFRLEHTELRHASVAGPQPPFARSGPVALAADEGQPGGNRNGSRDSRPEFAPAGSAASTAIPALGMPNRAMDLAEADADLLLVTAQADERSVQQVAGRADLVLLVGRCRSTRLRDVIAAVELLQPGTPPVVVLADHEHAAGRGPVAGVDASPPLGPASALVPNERARPVAGPPAGPSGHAPRPASAAAGRPAGTPVAASPEPGRPPASPPVGIPWTPPADTEWAGAPLVPGYTAEPGGGAAAGDRGNAPADEGGDRVDRAAAGAGDDREDAPAADPTGRSGEMAADEAGRTAVRLVAEPKSQAAPDGGEVRPAGLTGDG